MSQDERESGSAESTLGIGVLGQLDEARIALAQAEANEAELRLVIESMPQIVWITRPDGWHVYFNQKWFEFTGLTLEESLGHGWNPPFHPEDRPRAAARWEQATTTGEPYEIEYRLRRADGVYHWMLGRAVPLRDRAGNIVKWFGTCTDIEELKRAQDQIVDQARLLDLAQDAIFVKDLDHRVLYWNHGAERICGWTADEAIGRTLDELISPDRTAIDEALAVVHGQGDWNGELRFVDKSGSIRIMEARWTLLTNSDGSPRGVLAVNTDVTERRATEARFIQMLEAEATHDPLTGLPNRALLADRLEMALAAARRTEVPVAVLFIDLDAFKDINDSSGHLLGDEVLVRVAGRLQTVVRDEDTVARFGGDEFVVLLPHTDETVANEIAERLLATVREPMVFDGQRLHLSASIGVAVSPPVEPSSLLQAADAAVYHAKSQGRGQVRDFVGELSMQAEERLRLSSDLRDAIDRDELHLVYQPLVDLRSGEVSGVEALARWRHVSRGLVPPDVFITVAEKTGLARRLDAWILSRACREFAGLRRAGDISRDSYLAVNMTASSVADENLPATVDAALSVSGLAPQALVIEVTETSVMTDLEAGVAVLEELRDRGVRIAIDDFGTGWSSLTYLKRLPANILKLDRSFVGRLDQDEDDLAIAAAVVQLGQTTGMTVVAEGVETASQLAVLRRLGCDEGQGYLWHAGVPSEQLRTALRETVRVARRESERPTRRAHPRAFEPAR